ncbi:MAG: hypothetical protein U9Q30_04295 [Campylobacterota bacterium]|nr:hypothetical protein [Campylobacterota bacterium]
MTKVDRKENPIFTDYSDNSVQDALKKDFFKRCYICEEVTRHYEVEHFYPQKKYKHLENDYKNLFYSCQKCNKIKPKDINTSSENEIINCCEIDPSKYIKLRLNTKDCKVEIEKINDEPDKGNKVKETIKLLNRVYNRENSKSKSCEDLKDDIKEEIENFRKKLDKYEKTKLKRVAQNEIIEEISEKSAYISFKRCIIIYNQRLFKDFERYINIRLY